jgi:hypothetical protein
VAPKSARRILWLGLICMLPLPMLQFGAEIPALRYLLLAGVTLGLIVSEGMGQVPGLVLALLLGHALVYAGLLWLVAWLAARALSGLAPRALAVTTLGLVVAGVIVTSAFDVYRTPFGARSMQVNLLHVLE